MKTEIANYHTHTYRCHHADGSEPEYIENAIRGGLKILGFADHTPYPIYKPRPFRMTPEQLPDYVGTLNVLSERYRDQIKICIGMEVEYYPEYFPAHLDLLRDNGVQYMILGQHFLGNEIGEHYCSIKTEDPNLLKRYVEQTTEALQTGLFTYLAHPDVFYFTGSEDIYKKQMRLLCEAAKTTATPLEINLHGIRLGRYYPCERFWAIAGEVGNAVVLGSDAHKPEDVCDPAAEEKAIGLVKKYSLRLQETVTLRQL